MDIRSEHLAPGLTLVTLTGRLDIAGARAVDLPLAAQVTTQGARVIVDLSGVTFLSSLGIRSLLTPAKTARARGGELVLLDPQPAVLEVLTLAGLGKIIRIFTDREAAIAALSPA